MDADRPTPRPRGPRPDQALRRPDRGQESQPRSARRRDLRPDRPERLRQIDRDEGDHGHRAPDRRRGHLPGRECRRPARAQDRAQGLWHGVPALAAAEPADRAGEHHGRAAAGQPVHAVSRQGADRARQVDRRTRRPRRRDGPPPADAALRRSAPARTRQGDRARSQGRAGRRTLRGTDAGRSRHLLRADPQLPRRRPRGAAGRPQRQERRGAGRPGACDVSRRGDRHRPRRRGDAQRDRAPGLSRRRDRDLGAPRDQLQGQGAAAAGRERQRALRQGAGAGECLDPRPPGRVRLGGRPERRRQDHAVQHDLGLPALHRRHRSRRREAARHQPGARSRAAASCNARNRANCSAR